MQPSLELLVSVLEILAFILVTPEVLGKDKLASAYAPIEKGGIWLRTVWFNREAGQFSLSGMVFQVAVSVLTLLIIFGMIKDERIVYLAFFVIIIVPSVLAMIFILIKWLRDRVEVIRAFAILGAALFLTGRAIVIGSALSRLGG